MLQSQKSCAIKVITTGSGMLGLIKKKYYLLLCIVNNFLIKWGLFN